MHESHIAYVPGMYDIYMYVYPTSKVCKSLNIKRHDIADVLLKLALNSNQSINQSILNIKIFCTTWNINNGICKSINIFKHTCKYRTCLVHMRCEIHASHITLSFFGVTMQKNVT
jgi:hypothetical protein